MLFVFVVVENLGLVLNRATYITSTVHSATRRIATLRVVTCQLRVGIQHTRSRDLSRKPKRATVLGYRKPTTGNPNCSNSYQSVTTPRLTSTFQSLQLPPHLFGSLI